MCILQQLYNILPYAPLYKHIQFCLHLSNK